MFVKIGAYDKLGEYSKERQALDQIYDNFNNDVYNKMVDIMESGQIDNFDDVSNKAKYIQLLKMNIDIKNWASAAVFLLLLSNFQHMSDRKRLNQ